MRFSGCLIGVYLLPCARAGTPQLQVPAARAAAVADMPVRAFVSNSLFNRRTAVGGSRLAVNLIGGSWGTSPSRTLVISHGCSKIEGRCRVFTASSRTKDFGSDNRRLRTRTVLPARQSPLVSLSSSSSSSSSSASPSQSPLSTAAVMSSSPPLPSADSAAAEPGSALDVREGEPGGEWPVPHPSQVFVARARDGARYEHDVSGAGARRIRAVVSDLDGTLLGPDRLVSARTLEAVRRARAKGILFVPASGRSKAGMFSSMGELGEDLKRDQAPILCMNGLAVYGQGDGNGNGGSGDNGKIIYSAVMCPQLALQVVGFWKSHPLAEAAGVSLCGSEGEDIVVESLDHRTSRFTDLNEPLPKEVGSWEKAITGGMVLSRLYFWGPTRAAVDAFKVDLDAHLVDHPMELTRGVPEMIEVLPPGTSKAVGLEALLKDLGISPEEVVALGDMENDIEMLRAVGHGVAMGQASLEVRQAAQYTAPSNVLHGVAVALETFCDT